MSNRFLFNALMAGVADEIQQAAAASLISRLSSAVRDRDTKLGTLELEIKRLTEEISTKAARDPLTAATNKLDAMCEELETLSTGRPVRRGNFRGLFDLFK